MRKLAVVCIASALLAMPLTLLAAEAQPASQKKQGKVIAELKVLDHATVKAVDLKNRTVILEMSDGNLQEFVLDKRVKKLDKVEVGDVVKASYKEAITVRLKKTKSTPAVSVEESASRDAKSVKPSGVAKRQITVIATIDRILENGTAVTLKTPDGNKKDVRVLNPENLEKIRKGEVKEGDQVEITYRQALAISVEKVPQEKK